ncbi:MAG TPA: UdgX family uracil-DNA binding protein [Acidimicrobiales bacterium]
MQDWPDGLREAADEAAGCTRCDLYRNATQTVFGEGPAPASVMLVGEQPGDREDLAGHPFVGPAGRILDEALDRAGISRDDAYVTNAVKHFKWEPRGKRRIHKRPTAGEIVACSVWLEAEVKHVRPKVIVALGATAVRAVLGRPLSVGRTRGQVLESARGLPAVTTVHPASVVRKSDSEERAAARAGLVEDLRVAGRVASGHAG